MFDLSDDARAGYRRVEVLTGPGRRRRWSAESKAQVVAESLAPGARPSEVARRWQICSQQVFAWRKAAYRREVDQLVDLAGQVAACLDPVATLRRWLRANVEFVATKRGIAAALALAAYGNTELSAYTAEQLTGAVRRLMDRIATVHGLRDDIGPEDVLHMLVALCYRSDAAGWQANVLRLLDVFVDGIGSRDRCRAARLGERRADHFP